MCNLPQARIVTWQAPPNTYASFNAISRATNLGGVIRDIFNEVVMNSLSCIGKTMSFLHVEVKAIHLRLKLACERMEKSHSENGLNSGAKLN